MQNYYFYFISYILQIFNNCAIVNMYDYDYDYEMNLLRHKYM